MTENTEKPKQTSFHLHSFRNRHLYPASDYPITHLLDRLNIDRLSLKQISYVKHFKYPLILLLVCILIGTIFFRLHIQVYNTIFGPFYFNQEQFVEYVNRYEKDQSILSQFWKIEYIQVELNENNIQNPLSKYDTIRRFSNPRTRLNHIATYKRIKHPAIYVKLPTHSRTQFHARHRFHFQSYSIRTLQCIVRNLPLGSIDTYRTWIEKSEYVQHINKEYAKNSTEFNKAVLTKCGILIGYLYRPIKNLVIIQNDYDQLFVVILKVNLSESLDVHDESSPFIICPVTDIRKITQYGGICYGKDLSWIHWPTVEMSEQNYTEWLHEKLMEISDVYKRRYEERLRNERDDEMPSYFTDQSLESGITRRRHASQHNLRVKEEAGDDYKLSQLIREENNIQRLKIERQSITENIENLWEPISPATAEFIAKFRLEHERERKLVDMEMVKKQIECTLCQEDLKLNDSYAIWPCPGAHLFHYDCMLKSLRMRNACPNCRHEVEGVPIASTRAVLGRFLSRVLV
ncbi:unnamed protein product [Rotaria sordida]|uniref:RING-type domain-containing protein n=1 Tax=Rotaria sordida TaxID=392033 RepID=A0A818UJR8_9BILA|nr:unnamed protein product [Rotaria sordida]